MGKAGDIEAEEGGNALYYWHSSLGVLVFLLVLARIAWFFVSPPPRLPPSTSRLMRSMARSLHASFYALLLALPLSGWLASSAEGASVSFFGLGTLPRWEIQAGGPAARAAPEDEDKGTAARGESGEEFFEEAHEFLGDALLILVALHALAALKHHFVNGDDVLTRMLPRWKRPDEARPSG
jgi:cytochrome b561